MIRFSILKFSNVHGIVIGQGPLPDEVGSHYVRTNQSTEDTYKGEKLVLYVYSRLQALIDGKPVFFPMSPRQYIG